MKESSIPSSGSKKLKKLFPSDLATRELPQPCRATPAWITALPDPSMSELGAHVHGLWGQLYRQVCGQGNIALIGPLSQEAMNGLLT